MFSLPALPRPGEQEGILGFDIDPTFVGAGIVAAGLAFFFLTGKKEESSKASSTVRRCLTLA